MGMDVYGKNPRSATGEYFRRNVWGWRPLAEFIRANAPDEAAGCKYWHSNDGDGLDDLGATALALKLYRLFEDGAARDWITERDAALAALPDEPCKHCNGTGIRSDETAVKLGWPLKVVEATDANGRPNPRAGQIGSCNACGGRGSAKPFATSYHLEERDVTEFAAFLAECGGFEIC